MTAVTRRSFLVGSATALMASGLRGVPLMADSNAEVTAKASSQEKYGGFKMGIQSFSLRHFNLEDTIKHIGELGLHWVEFFPGHYGVNHEPSRIDHVAGLLKPHDLHMSVHGVHGFGGNEAQSRRIFEFAKLAGIPVLSADPAPDSFPILDKLVKEFDIKVGIHNHGPNHRYDTVEDSLNAVRRWDKRIGFCPDTGHYMRSGEEPAEALRKLGDRLYGIHLKDHERIARDNPHETILGEGAIDLKAVCQVLREVKFDAPLSLEYELNAQDPFDDIRQGLSNFAAAAKSA